MPYRQWVLTLPGELARVVAFDAGLATAVFGVFADEVARWQRECADKEGIVAAETGCLLEIQRYADGARLYPHAHVSVQALKSSIVSITSENAIDKVLAGMIEAGRGRRAPHS